VCNDGIDYQECGYTRLDALATPSVNLRRILLNLGHG